MECETFRFASTGLDHALVVACDLTQIAEEGSVIDEGQLISLITIRVGGPCLQPDSSVSIWINYQCVIKTCRSR